MNYYLELFSYSHYIPWGYNSRFKHTVDNHMLS